MQIRDTVRQFIKDSFLVDDFEDTASFLNEGIVDSLGVMQLVAFVEAEYGFKVSERELLPQNFDSVERVSAYVERKRAACSAGSQQAA